MLTFLDEENTYTGEASPATAFEMPPKPLLACAARSGSLRVVECIPQSKKVNLKDDRSFPLSISTFDSIIMWYRSGERGFRRVRAFSSIPIG
jgi:hypothetical protein